MEKLLFPSITDVAVLPLDVSNEAMRIEARSTVAGAAWPDCESEARRVHSSYLRFPADVPSGGRRVVLRLRVDHGRRAATNEVATAQSRVIGLRDQEPRLGALGSGGGGAASPRDAEDLARRAFRDEAADPARCQCAGDHGRHKPGPAARVAGTTAWLPPAASPIPDIIPNGTRATQDSNSARIPPRTKGRYDECAAPVRPRLSMRRIRPLSATKPLAGGTYAIDGGQQLISH